MKSARKMLVYKATLLRFFAAPKNREKGIHNHPVPEKREG
jgi:hypothetical protein